MNFALFLIILFTLCILILAIALVPNCLLLWLIAIILTIIEAYLYVINNKQL